VTFDIGQPVEQLVDEGALRQALEAISRTR
jgi:hypothetical protein